MHAYSWSSSIGVTLAFHFGLDAYGFAGNFCWIKSSLSYLWLPAYYIPLIAILLYTVGVFAYTMWRLREGRKIGSVREDTPDRLLAHSQRRLSLFAVIFFVYALANLANRIYGMTMDRTNFTLEVVQAIFAPTQGLGDCTKSRTAGKALPTCAERRRKSIRSVGK